VTTYAPNAVADELYDGDVRAALVALTAALADVEDPLVRLAVMARLEERLKPVLEATKTFAAREARDAGETHSAIGAALGVTAQRAHQLANLPEETVTP
jgi:hypothetical protein